MILSNESIEVLARAAHSAFWGNDVDMQADWNVMSDCSRDRWRLAALAVKAELNSMLYALCVVVAVVGVLVGVLIGRTA